ncbi:MAG: HipA domain-containing protein [Silicimonas sp.]|uniref:type II toxin-antitoxin system HipA family toxin n=1 Tax=Rhodobacterales TaxID=204455 RepID=UPI0008069A2D|nr:MULTISPECIES: HipA domain-containing protein [Rhodobacterales]MCE8522423.1 HipA domain-containing protein [Ruegeria pomeroyi]MCE8529968.1 HipA domain-containing protein [Ruegeria pomeroyi]QFT61013.1 Serine/threonine-protein kinase HipA [Sulfitobacter sp. THAF37]SDY08729.1 serine/threonine-protein kinase HipA [Tritonibacter mobilis]GLP88190.1 kinase [Tritonibacter mobilis]
MSNVSVLNVNLYGEPIGTLTNLGGDRTIFAFTDEYIENPDRPTLGLAFKDEFGELYTDFRPYQKRVMPFFSNLLPEGHLRKYLAEQAGVNPEREFYLLWALGHDLPGAITITPADGEAWPPDAADGADDHGDDQRENALRFSLAGVQLKFSAVMEASGGLTIPASGVGGSWIVKLPSREFAGVPENEFSMMKLAGLIGMNVPAIDLVSIDAIKNLPEGIDKIGNHAFVIERFDRLSDGSRVHIEDFAQVYGLYPEDKYGNGTFRNIAQVIAAEGNDADIIEYVRRLTFNMLIGNADMHMKNWSLIYPDRRYVSLAPAYDFVATVPYIPGDATNMKISRAKVFSAFSVDELEHLAVKASIPRKMAIDAAQETVQAFREHWGTEAANLPMSDEVRSAVEDHMKTVPILEELS